MRKKFHIVLLILFLGIFLTPNFSHACGTKSEKSCCKKEMPSKSEKKECCKNKKSDNEKEKGCNGKCGHSNCSTSVSQFSLIMTFNEIEFNNNVFDFTSQKQKFYHNETNISSGFYSVWLPPKIN